MLLTYALLASFQYARASELSEQAASMREEGRPFTAVILIAKETKSPDDDEAEVLAKALWDLEFYTGAVHYQKVAGLPVNERNPVPKPNRVSGIPDVDRLIEASENCRVNVARKYEKAIEQLSNSVEVWSQQKASRLQRAGREFSRQARDAEMWFARELEHIEAQRDPDWKHLVTPKLIELNATAQLEYRRSLGDELLKTVAAARASSQEAITGCLGASR